MQVAYLGEFDLLHNFENCHDFFFHFISFISATFHFFLKQIEMKNTNFKYTI